MARTYGTIMNGLLNTVPKTIPHVGDWGSRVRVKVEKNIVLAAQAAGDDIVVGQLASNERFFGIAINSSVSLGGVATIAAGIDGDTAKYKTAGIHTTPEQWIIYGKPDKVGEKPANPEDIILTIAAAALPGAGNLRVALLYLED